MIENLASIFVLAVLVEGIITYFISDPDKKQPWLKYVSAALGVVVCVLYKVDLLGALGVMTDVPFVGSVLTGIIVSRGSNYINDFISKVRDPKPEVVVNTTSE